MPETRPLNVLIVEDSVEDAQLVLYELGRSGFEPNHRRVETALDFTRELESGSWDIILSDYSMPQFSAIAALELLHESGREIPFVVVTGTIDEETAVGCLKRGADNYILKENLARLGTAVTQALGVFEERREKRQLEEQLRQAQKMEAIGQLAGGVAHDFNNLLQAILGHTELLIQDLPPDSSAQEGLDVVKSAAQRAAELTRQLLTFSRRQDVQKEYLDLNDVIGNLMKMLRRVIEERIETCVIPGPDLARIHADPGQIEQVLMNLCVNARDAMPKEGTITIETSNVHLSASDCQKHPWAREGHYVTLTVSDTGEGIHPEFLDRIFEPFFTTKGPGEGTGLGLATVYGIVNRHEGLINVSSELGKGTAFQVYLPASEATPTGTGGVSEWADEAVGGTEMILLAEDDEHVRNLATLILERAGYHLLVARDGAEAMALLERHCSAIDLAILDAIMPRQSGREVYDAMKHQCAEVPVLFCSGYAFADDESQSLPEDAQMLNKPYHPTELLHAVRRVLDKHAN